MRVGLSILAVLLGCVEPGGAAGTYCRNSTQCRGELICVALTCREPPRLLGGDAGATGPLDATPADARLDATEDASFEDASTADAATADASSEDAGSDDGGADDGGSMDGGAEDPCGPIAAAGHVLCVREAGRCEAVFEGGETSCNTLCALAELSCTGAFTPDATMCMYDAGASTGCGNGSRATLHCVCTGG